MKELKDLAGNCLHVLTVDFNCSDFEVNDFIRTLEQSLHSFTSDYVKRLFRDINSNLLRRFSKEFKKDENGKNREWRDIDEAKIRELWQKYRAQMLEIIQDFKYIRLPKGGLLDMLS